MSTPFETVGEFIDVSIRAWSSTDTAPLGRFFNDASVNQNMPMDAVVGRDAILMELTNFIAMGGDVEVEISHLMTDGR